MFLFFWPYQNQLSLAPANTFADKRNGPRYARGSFRDCFGFETHSRRIPLQGSPASAATFLDESANGSARDLARGLHRSTWTRRFFQFWKRLESPGKRLVD